jgi:DNA ligase-1
MRTFDSIINLGYEGIIIRHAQAPYERKRSTMIMKFKPKKEDDYEIVGYEEEISIEGRPKNTLGSLLCKSNDGNTFNIGTGFSKDQREHLWRVRETLPTRIAKVKYQHLTSGKQVPRFPVFVEIIKTKED